MNRSHRFVALVVTLAVAASVAGCGYSVPFLATPDAGSGGATAAAAKAPPQQKRPKKEKKSPEPKAAAAKPKHDDAKAERMKANDKRSKTKSDKAPPRASSLRDKIEEARANAALAPAEPYWPYREAELCVQADSLGAATAALRHSLARNGGYAPALALLSKLEFDAGRHDDAIAVLESARMAAQRSSRDLAPELLAGLALHYDASGRPADAQEALAAVPRSEHAAADAAAAALALKGGAESAPELAEVAAREHPKSAACQNNLGIARLRAGDPAGARKAFVTAVELDPRLPGAYYNLAILEKFYTLDDDAARDWFAKYRALATDDPDGLAQVLGVSSPKDLAEGSKP